MFFRELTVDLILKIFQILFYIITSTVAVLTYRSAKRGLLNTVNTEYQKKVINRLEELAKELGSEFDPKSQDYWAKRNPIKEIITEINEVFTRNKKYILKIGEYPFGILVSTDIIRINQLIAEIKSDPFIPSKIRKIATELLESRVNTISEVYHEATESYIKAILKGKNLFGTDGNDPNFDKFHNKIIEKLNKLDCGISQIEKDVHKIRLCIQEYFESFNPIKGN